MDETKDPILDEKKLDAAIGVLDALLGAEARKPGNAQKLPAVVRVIESLEPAGGMQFPVFPASYAGDGQNAPPVYDLNGIEYGTELELVRTKDRERRVHYITKARHCTIDSPQSQANRTEVAFVDDADLAELVPQATTRIPRAEGKKDSESVLRLPHRIADFRVRLSDKKEVVKKAISDLAEGKALSILRLMPTSIIFGFWDSRGDEAQHKRARLLLSRIDAFDVVPCRKRAVYTGPYSKDEFAQVVLKNNELAAAVEDGAEKAPEDGKSGSEKKAFDTMAARGYTAALSGGALGGILVEGKIERLSLISLTDIARLSCAEGDPENATKLTNAGRRYIFALAALAEAYPRTTGSHRLRSGCELITLKKTVELRGSDEYQQTGELLAIISDRTLLIQIASQAKGVLEIPSCIDEFIVTTDSLKGDFESATKKARPSTTDRKSARQTKDKEPKNE